MTTAELLIRINANTAKLDQIDKKVNKVKKSTKDTSNNFTSMAKQIGVATVAMLALNKAAEQVGKAIQTFGEFQKFEAVLRTAFGSGAQAFQAMSMIQEFASSTPFQVDEITASFIKLKNRGLNPTTKELRKMGDLSASQGKSFDQLTEAILDSMTGENEMLKEFGIKAQKSGEKTKFTFKGITKEVENTEEAIKAAILSFGEMEGIAGSMSNISQTQQGKLSNLSDKYTETLNLLGKELSSPLNELVRVASSILGWLSSDLKEKQERERYMENREEMAQLIKSAKAGNESDYKTLTSLYPTLKTESKFGSEGFAAELDALMNNFEKILTQAENIKFDPSETASLFDAAQQKVLDLDQRLKEYAIELEQELIKNGLSETEMSKLRNENIGKSNAEKVQAYEQARKNQKGFWGQAFESALNFSTGRISTEETKRTAAVSKYADLTATRDALKKKNEEEEKAKEAVIGKLGTAEQQQSAKTALGMGEPVTNTTTESDKEAQKEAQKPEEFSSSAISSKQNVYTINIESLIDINQLQSFKNESEAKNYLLDLAQQAMKNLTRDID